NDVLWRVGQAAHLLVAFEHVADVIDGGKGNLALDIAVQVGGIGRDDHPSAPCPDPDDLQAGRVPADQVHAEARREFGRATVEFHLAAIELADETDDVLDVEGMTKGRVAHAPAGG